MKTQLPITKTKIRRGDKVRVLLGKDRNKTGTVLAMLPQRGRVVVSGLNKVKKHVKGRGTANGQPKPGERIEIEAPLELSNVQVVCPTCQKGTRIGIKRNEAGRERICKQCEAVIPTQKVDVATAKGKGKATAAKKAKAETAKKADHGQKDTEIN